MNLSTRSPLLCLSTLTACLMLQGAAWAANSVTLNAPLAGDAGYAWNSKFGPYGYTVGGTELGVGLQMAPPYGNDYTVGIIEIPITALQGGDLLGAQLQLNTVGNFGTGYYYGSVAISWLDTGARSLTGDVVADGLGAIVSGGSGGWSVWSSYTPEGAMLKQFDVTSAVQADLHAGRSFSTFVLNGSRDTYGSIYAAESGLSLGPRLLADTTAAVPEPGSGLLLLGGVAILASLLHRRRSSTR
ncbi:PEP-CTERM sorting domain-containing protein [Paucibacter sp. TC2R-5]|uniref:PEP-CTERM sorting domain-containing protein n=1 Tax=Paucibacter sp. TC2R-5 TaxID=2893555 RepID=UPI0021E3CC3C|nr:PEP-CTERM sorting domain-containing protein [Paucibacter sp. TC2R-5]MCV2358059.1 PEP-CTERM sorting domain-containing protein [Paucibacter sp. TC2R-5]